MSFRDILSDEFLLEGRNYANTIRRALICLLLGGGFLGLERLLHGTGVSGTRLLIAHLSEFLGWAFLLSSVVLLSLLGKSANGLERQLLPWKTKKPGGKKPSIVSEIRSASARRAQAIDELYAELRPLMSRAAVDPSLKDEVQDKLSVLRRLQTEEAEEMEKRFEASLLLKPGEGWQALERTRELLARYEDPSSPHSPTSRKS